MSNLFVQNHIFCFWQVLGQTSVCTGHRLSDERPSFGHCFAADLSTLNSKSCSWGKGSSQTPQCPEVSLCGCTKPWVSLQKTPKKMMVTWIRLFIGKWPNPKSWPRAPNQPWTFPCQLHCWVPWPSNRQNSVLKRVEPSPSAACEGLGGSDCTLDGGSKRSHCVSWANDDAKTTAIWMRDDASRYGMYEKAKNTGINYDKFI